MLYVFNALLDLGWKPESDKMMTFEEMAIKLGVIPSMILAFRHLLTYLCHDGLLESRLVEQGVIKFTKAGSELDLKDVSREIQHLLEDLKDYPVLEVIHACGSQLARVWKGTTKGVNILFGNQSSNGLNLAEYYYQMSRFNYGSFIAPAQVTAQLAKQISDERFIKSKSGISRAVRILEVGAGTGTYTSLILPKLKELGIDFCYYFTDISPSFFAKASSKFMEHEGQMVYKTLDVEKDPLKQGFCPGYFDIVVGVDVFHATKDLSNSIRNIRMTTRKGGLVVIGEMNIPIREVDIVFGIMDGYWQFEDSEMRKAHCTIHADKWIEILKRNGFKSNIHAILFSEDQTSVITGQLTDNGMDIESNGNEWVVVHDEMNKDALEYLVSQMKEYGRQYCLLPLQQLQSEILGDNLQNHVNEFLDGRKGNLEGVLYLVEGCISEPFPCPRKLQEPLLCISKYLLQSKLKTLPKLHIVTKGTWVTGEEADMQKSLHAAATLWGFMRTTRIEITGLVSKSIDLDPCEEDGWVNYQNLFSELWLDDKETEVVFRGGVRHVRRLTQHDSQKVISTASKPLSIENLSQGNRLTVEIPKSRLLSDLKFKAVEEDYPVREGQVEVEVRCASLNFRDVLVVMKPSQIFEGMNTMGLDFSGVVSAVGEGVDQWNVGDSVIGVHFMESTLSSHVTVDANMLTGIPYNFSFAEAATLPAVFFTAWYCMVNIANLKRGQTVLVHAASGGVGLMAIQIAKWLGVNVIGTAGSSKKRNFVRARGVEHVFSSRDLEYGGKIKEVTNGKGVDMVLNCLTGPGFKETSLDVCRDGGHFVEISKLDVWSVEEVRTKRPSVHYNIVDVDYETTKGLVKQLREFLGEGQLKPLPFTSFPASGLVEAMTFLQKAKQIGKVIVEMPRLDLETGVLKEYIFNDRSTYMITGGRGGIGLAVAQWMVTQGAKYLVLVGRSPPDENALCVVAELEDSGAVVVNAQVDISDYVQCKRLFEQIRCNDRLPPLRGIHHCAGMISDQLIGKQEWENFENVFGSKVNGSYNLHSLTLDYPLEFFVMYSSMASTFGNIGQSNYSAANAYMDALAPLRNSMGLKGTSLQWGQWIAGIAENLESHLLEALTVQDGIRALEHCMRWMRGGVSVAAVGNVYFSTVTRRCPSYETTLLETCSRQLPSGGNSGNKEQSSKVDKVVFKSFYESLEIEEEREEAVRKFVVGVVCETLGLQEHELDPHTDFFDIGMDSLMAIELNNRLQSEMGETSFGLVDIEEYGTVVKMSQLVKTVLNVDAVSK